MSSKNDETLTIVDNLAVTPPETADTVGMHFGALLKSLREPRGLTQQGLADAAESSVQTIYQGERSEKCPWKRSTATRVLNALEAVASLSTNERENYLQLAGLEALSKMAASIEDKRRRDLADLKARVAAATMGFDTSDDLDLTTAHQYVQKLYEEVGPTRLLSALEGLAVSWELDLPPRIRR